MKKYISSLLFAILMVVAVAVSGAGRKPDTPVPKAEKSFIVKKQVISSIEIQKTQAAVLLSADAGVPDKCILEAASLQTHANEAQPIGYSLYIFRPERSMATFHGYLNGVLLKMGKLIIHPPALQYLQKRE